MKLYFPKIATAIFFFSCFATIGLAQTPIENLQNAVQEYNAMREYMNGFNAKTVNEDHLAALKQRMDRGTPMLGRVIREGTAEQIKTARYFNANFKYQYGFVLGMMGRNSQAYEVMKEIESDFTGLTAADFPLRYEFFGKNFIINWDNFATSQAEYLTGMGEIAYNLGKYEEANRFNRMALNHSSLTSWLKYITVNKILDVYSKSSTGISEKEYLDFAKQSMETYDLLDASLKETVKENNYPTTLRGADIFLRKATANPTSDLVARCAEAAPLAAKYEKSQPTALKLLEICYRNNHKDIKEFHQVAVNLAKTQLSADRTTANYVALAALDQLAATISATDCAAMPAIANDYAHFGATAKSTAMNERHRKCLADQEMERQRQEELRRKQEEIDRKRQHRYEHPFNIYAGFNLLPIMTKPEKMDFGGHVDLRGRRVAHSFGYAIVKAKNDLHSANEDWDGYRAFYALKVFGKSLSDQLAYTGFYLGYSEKEFRPLLATVRSKTDPNDWFQATVIPLDKQYDLVWNGGIQALGKGFGMDIWYGIGASYYQLSYDEFNFDDYTVTDHEFFESRDKKDSFSIFMRLGISVGLNLGRKRT